MLVQIGGVKTKLSETAVNWAKKHIQNFYDSDFFYKPFEFDGLWANWNEVSEHLTHKDIQSFVVKKPIFYPAPKKGVGFRIVHQLDPIDSLVYTSLAYEIAQKVEDKRLSNETIFSYRIDLNDQGDFFVGGSGYDAFKAKSGELAESFNYVLVTDITDFYNQIYHHRLQNAIELCDPSLNELSTDIEIFLMKITNKVSRGIPVGPAASIIMAEALFNDIDEFIYAKNQNYVRYVDDIRIFSNSKIELENILHDLTEYLYQNHRLTLSSHKTEIFESIDFILGMLENPNEQERTAIHQALSDLNIQVGGDYCDVEPINGINELPQESRIKVQGLAFQKLMSEIVSSDRLDLGLARHILRRAKKLRSRVILKNLLNNFDFFTPVIRDVILYLEEVSSEKMFEYHQNELERVLKESNSLKYPFINYWITTFFATTSYSSSYPFIKDFINQKGDLRAKALFAVKDNRVWWVRREKDRIDHVSPWERRAIIYSGRLLSDGERGHWMNSIIRDGDLEDKSMAIWIKSL